MSVVYRDWLPSGGSSNFQQVPFQRKQEEMELADLVLVPSSYAKATVQRFCDKKVECIPYGVDLEFWQPSLTRKKEDVLRFIFPSHISLRKGAPFLFEAWKKANLSNAELLLVGTWQLDESKKRDLPSSVRWVGPHSPEGLRSFFHESDVMIFPSFFEGYGLVITEALACGVPVIASDATAGPDILDEHCGRVFKSSNQEELIGHLQYFSAQRDALELMNQAARSKAESQTWEIYRHKLWKTVEGYFD
jgi:glycosyltransferase involved in cell wall biosynthesis